ncbi:MAG: fumarate hydratase [Oscillospiraceae bacterium]|nr:fumarate hydratase [Oscillospiraceae bacterium]MDD4415037.1 fumarate hydratase [Oscillospiraceae bacterium]
MRTINVSMIEEAIRSLCIEANRRLSPDVKEAVCNAADKETSPLGKDIMIALCENMSAAERLELPVCQDTGMAVVFAQVGQEVHIEGGLLSDAVNRGVSRGYLDGLLRCSVVSDPLRRVNANDNTPAVLHTCLTAGDRIKLTVAPKGFGSENMSKLRMFTPAANYEDILNFIRDTAKAAGSNACPPMVLGVGIGGDFEMCAILAKRALCRPLNLHNPDPYYAQMECDALEAVNALDIGPQGFGGLFTALGVAIETYPTHIAGLPVAVNVGCHVTRHASCEI